MTLNIRCMTPIRWPIIMHLKAHNIKQDMAPSAMAGTVLQSFLKRIIWPPTFQQRARVAQKTSLDQGYLTNTDKLSPIYKTKLITNLPLPTRSTTKTSQITFQHLIQNSNWAINKQTTFLQGAVNKDILPRTTRCCLIIPRPSSHHRILYQTVVET